MASRILSIALLILFTACEKVELDKIENLNNNSISVIGHGGSGFQSPNNYLPHNSYLSVINGVESLGADGVEIDIQISKDSIIYMYHDTQLYSMTDCDECVYTQTSEYLNKCRYKNSMAVNTFLNEKVTPLEKVIKRFAQRKVKPLIFLDIKNTMSCSTGDYTESMLKAVLASEIVRLIDKYQATGWILSEATEIDLLQQIKALNPEAKCFWYTVITPETIRISKENNFEGFVSYNHLTSAEAVKQAHAAGLQVSLFNVKTRDGVVDAIRKHPDFIETDNILLLQQALNK